MREKKFQFFVNFEREKVIIRIGIETTTNRHHVFDSKKIKSRRDFQYASETHRKLNTYYIKHMLMT